MDLNEPCAHRDFASAARIGRLTQEAHGPIIGYAVDFRAWCVNCGAPLCFRLQRGVHIQGVTMSMDGQEARLMADMGRPEDRVSFEETEVRLETFQQIGHKEGQA